MKRMVHQDRYWQRRAEQPPKVQQHVMEVLKQVS